MINLNNKKGGGKWRGCDKIWTWSFNFFLSKVKILRSREVFKASLAGRSSTQRAEVQPVVDPLESYVPTYQPQQTWIHVPFSFFFLEKKEVIEILKSSAKDPCINSRTKNQTFKLTKFPSTPWPSTWNGIVIGCDKPWAPDQVIFLKRFHSTFLVQIISKQMRCVGFNRLNDELRTGGQ